MSKTHISKLVNETHYMQLKCPIHETSCHQTWSGIPDSMVVIVNMMSCQFYWANNLMTINTVVTRVTMLPDRK